MLDFDALFAQHAPRMIAIARSIVGTRQDAEDVVQDAFLKAYRARDRFKPDAKPQTWLKRIVVNQAIDVRRRKKTRREAPDASDTLASDGLSPEARASSSERSRIVRQAINNLPEHQREVLWLRELSGLGYREIAERLGLARGTVESRVIRGREALRQSLGALLRADGNGAPEAASNKERLEGPRDPEPTRKQGS
ncbi:MAG: RNA polymerase sigma factor [Planctomycetota bacterium]|jgi:RNA polymerase sigma-70 factor (ECF subfamily)